MPEEEKIFEKIIPKGKLEEEKKVKGKPVPKAISPSTQKEQVPTAAVSELKKIIGDLSYVNKELDEMEEKINNLEYIKKEVSELRERLEGLNYINKDLNEFRKKIQTFENRLKGLENIEVISSKMEGFEKIKDFNELLKKFDEKLNQIEESRKEVFLLGNDVKKMYEEIGDKLFGLETILKKLGNLNRLSNRMEKFEFYIKNKIENSFASWEFSREAIEQMKLSILEQKFLVIVLSLPFVKERNLKMRILEKLTKTVEEMRSKDLWDLEKKLLLEDILKTQEGILKTQQEATKPSEQP